MTPYERTLQVLIDLDNLLEKFNKKQDSETQDKITHIVRWLNKELNQEAVLRVLWSQYFEYGDVIASLLKEKYFNPKEQN